MEEKKFTIRCSALNRLPNCYGYQLLIDRIKSETKYTRTGTLGHAWLEDWANAKYNKSIADNTWNKHLQEAFDSGDISGDPDDLLQTCHDFADWYVKNLPPGKLVSTELAGELERDEYRILGHCDAIYWSGGKRTVTIVDYKFYNRIDQLPKVYEDNQMKAYAVLFCRLYPSFRTVVVRRLFCRQRQDDTLIVNRSTIKNIEQDLDKICMGAVNNRNTFTVGDHCSSCLARNKCDSFMGAADGMETSIEPYRGGAIVSNAQALKILRAIPAAETILSKAKDEIRKYVQNNGQIIDPKTEKKYCYCDKKRETVEDHKTTISEVYDLIGSMAFNGIRVSKKWVYDRAEESGIPKEIADRIIGKLRKSGAVREHWYKALSWTKE